MINKIRMLYRRVNRDKKSSSPEKCNNYIYELEKLKDELFDLDLEWIENYDEVDEVDEEGFLSDGAEKDEILEALNEVSDQLEQIACHMEFDIFSQTTAYGMTGNIPSVNINFNPQMTQNVDVSSNAQINMEIKQKVDNLVREFEKEFQKSLPDKSKLKKIIEKLKPLGKYAAPFVEEFSRRIGGFFF